MAKTRKELELELKIERMKTAALRKEVKSLKERK